MATRLQIVNGALVKLGARIITSISGQEKEAKVTAARFDACRQAVLRLYSWAFATTQVVLTSPAPTPAFGFTVAFGLPGDCLRVVRINEGDEEFSVVGDTVQCDSTEIRLTYVYDYGSGENDTFSDPLFCECLSLYLAWDCAYSLTQSSELRDAMWALFDRRLLPLTRHVASTEHSGRIVGASDFDNARRSYRQFVRDPGT